MVRTFFLGKGFDYVENSAQIECVGGKDEVCLSIDEGDMSCFISLDKSTAIRLAKKLRTEINKIQEGGQNV